MGDATGVNLYLQALMTGSIPGFVDVILNFGSTTLTEDNLLSQMKLAGKILTFFGDDTWLNLFPNTFNRSDGTTSFFVADYTEVDKNVTRHLDAELLATDWDVMVLHYLGLDHIGHLAGPYSPLVPPKLAEMDSVVNQIFSAMMKWSEQDQASLLVVCGDHGMSDQGGHGGASVGEVTVPIIMLSPHVQFQPSTALNTELQQIDLCPTLSALFGLPFPKNNLGFVQMNALPVHTSIESKVRLLQLNAAQLVAIFKENIHNIDKADCYQLYLQAVEEHAAWLLKKNTSSQASFELAGTSVISAYLDSMQKISGHIRQTSTRYDMYGIGLALTLLWMSFVIQVRFRSVMEKESLIKFSSRGLVIIGLLALFAHVTICTSQHSHSVLCETTMFSLAIQLIGFTGCAIGSVWLLIFSSGCFSSKAKRDCCFEEMVLIAGTLFHALTLMSSSFVEEEHQTWYFFAASFHTFLLAKLVIRLIKQTSCSLQYMDHQQTVNNSEGSQSTDLNHENSDMFNTRSLVISQSLYTSEHLLAHQNRAETQERFKHKPQERESIKQEFISNIKLQTAEHSPHDVKSVKERNENIVNFMEVIKWAFAPLGILCLFRIMRCWNQTGNKWLDIPDVGDWLVRPEHKFELSCLFMMSILFLILLRFSSCQNWTSRLIWVGALGSAYWSKTGLGAVTLPASLIGITSLQGVTEGRLAYILIATHLVMILLCGLFCCNSVLPKQFDQKGSVNSKGVIDIHLYFLENIQTAWLALMCLLFRPHNMALVAMTAAMERLACKVISIFRLKPRVILLYCQLMGSAAFFLQGNSNSLSTVDVSAGYIGLTHYQPVLIGLQMFVSTYSSSIFWFITCFKCIHLTAPVDRHYDWLSRTYADLASVALLTRTFPLSLYTSLATFQRYHLFVWTVFSPKLLYEAVLTIVVFVFTLICLMASKHFADSVNQN